MKIPAWALSLSALGLFVSLAGCANDSPTSPSPATPPATEKQALIQSVQSDSLGELSASDEFMIDDGGPMEDDLTFAKEATAIHPLRWGRRILNVTRHVDVEFQGDTAAVATLTKEITGVLIIAATYEDTGSMADTVIRKPFSEQVRRKILFRRIARTADYGHNWMPVAVTLVEGRTQPDSVNLFSITSVDFTFPWAKDTITDPLDTWLRFGRIIRGVPLLHVLDSVRVVLHVSSADPDTEHAFLRYYGEDLRRETPFPVYGVRRVRMKLLESAWNGSAYNRTYEALFYGQLQSMLPIGRFHAALDVMSHGSLYDDARPFSNIFWELPYFVVHW